MTRYVPILKGMPAEFNAWANASAAVRLGATPLFEVVPKSGLDEDLRKFTDRLSSSVAASSVVAFDTGYLDQVTPVGTGVDAASVWTAKRILAFGAIARPTVRIDDVARVVDDAASIAATHGEGVTLRIGGNESDPDVDLVSAQLPALLSQLRLATSDIHLVVDFFDLKDARDVARTLPIANSCLAWAASVGQWASVTVGSGAFPATVSHLEKSIENRLPRLDAEFWTRLNTPHGLMVQYADYAINHPALGGVGRGPLPSLRYTDGNEWIVWREAKTRPGNESFFTVCQRVVALPAFAGQIYSWGDSEIHRCSTSTGGAGTATQWRGYGTSHHLETVVDRLATLGAP